MRKRSRTGPEGEKTEPLHGGGPTAPRLTGVVGSPGQVARSLSPAIHNAAYRAAGMDWLYLSFGLEPQHVVAGIRGLAAGGVIGMNVTLPYKVAAMEAVDILSESAERIGALNTVEVRAGALVGWNTDGEGLVRFLRMDAGARIEGARVLVLGAGGSARAVIFALGQAGAQMIDVLARDADRARMLEPLAGAAGFSAGSLSRVTVKAISRADIIVNATPLGQADEDPAIPTSSISSRAIVVDLVYRPPVTALIREARARGADAYSGLGMLLHQAALAFEIWTGSPPSLDAMSAAALSSLTQTASSPDRAS